MKRLAAIGLIVALNAVAAGCGPRAMVRGIITHGTPVDWEKVREVKVGMTANELRQRLGEPYQITSRGDTEIWAWVDVNRFSFSRRSFSIILKDNAAISVPRVPDSFDGGQHDQVIEPPAVDPAPKPPA